MEGEGAEEVTHLHFEYFYYFYFYSAYVRAGAEEVTRLNLEYFFVFFFSIPVPASCSLCLCLVCASCRRARGWAAEKRRAG